MKASAILEALPRKKEIQKGQKALRKQIDKLIGESEKTEALLDEIEGVFVHDGQPVRELAGGSEFFEFENVVGKTDRFARGVLEDGGWVVSNDSDVTLGTFAKRSVAEKIAAAYVLTGKAVPADASKPKRGRPRKEAV